MFSQLKWIEFEISRGKPMIDTAFHIACHLQNFDLHGLLLIIFYPNIGKLVLTDMHAAGCRGCRTEAVDWQKIQGSSWCP